MHLTKELKKWATSINDEYYRLECLIYLYISGISLKTLCELFNCERQHLINTLICEKMYEYRICNKCGILKHYSEFGKNKSGDHTIRSQCKLCFNDYYKQYYEDNSKRIRPSKNESAKKYEASENGKMRRINYMKKYNKLNSEKIYNYHVEYRKRYYSIDENKIKRRLYQTKRRNTDPLFRLRHNISNRINSALKKGKSISDIFKFTLDELKIHLESQFDEMMSWENYGSYWEVDHKIPLDYYKLTSIEDPNFEIAWRLENLRPLQIRTNRRKSNIISEKWGNLT